MDTRPIQLPAGHEDLSIGCQEHLSPRAAAGADLTPDYFWPDTQAEASACSRNSRISRAGFRRLVPLRSSASLVIINYAPQQGAPHLIDSGQTEFVGYGNCPLS
jgi:hypothetical protein